MSALVDNVVRDPAALALVAFMGGALLGVAAAAAHEWVEKRWRRRSPWTKS